MAIKPVKSGYRVRVGQHGTARTFPTKKLAEKYEREERERNAQARAGLEIETRPMTYAEMVQLYYDNHEPSKWLRSMIDYSLGRWGRTYVHALKGQEVGKWLKGLKRTKGVNAGQPLAPKTRQHILDSMRQVINQGVEWGYPRKNPIGPKTVKVKGGHGASDVDPFESWADVERVAGETSRVIDQALVLFIAATGLRPEEALALRWNRLDLNDGTGNVLTVVVDGEEHDAGKTPGALRPFILPQRAIDALDLLPEPLRRSQLVFSNTRGGFINLDNFRKRVWKKAMERTDLKWRTLYQLRHTFATLALEKGVPIELVKEQLGHTNISTTLKHYAKYRKASADRMRSILDAPDDTKETDEEGVREGRLGVDSRAGGA